MMSIGQELVGHLVVVRDNMAGVHFGRLAEFDAASKSASIIDARKVWYWRGAASCHGLAARGLDHDGSKVCPVVSRVTMTNVVEVIACSSDGAVSLGAAPEWKP